MPRIETPETAARHTGPLLALLTALSTLGLLATNLYLPSLPGLAADLSLSADQARLTFTVFLAGLAASQLVIGPLSDRYGRRPLLLTGVALYVVMSAACAFAASLEALLVTRLLQAIGACAGVVVVRAIARDLFEGAALMRAMSIIATLMATAPGFSPLLGGLIETWFGWRGNFVALTGFSAVLMLLVWRLIGETNLRRGAIAAPRAIAGGYVTLLGDVRFMTPALATSSAMGALFAYFAGSPVLIIEVLGFAPIWFGVITAGTVFAVFAGGFAGPRLAARIGPMRALAAGMVLMVTGTAAMTAIFARGEITLVTFLMPQVVFLVGMGLVNPLGTAAALQPFPERAGAASAMLGFLQMGAGTIGTALLTLMPGAAPLPLALTMFAAAALGLVVFATLRLTAPRVLAEPAE